MAHDKLYGICENKCMVEVSPKTETDATVNRVEAIESQGVDDLTVKQYRVGVNSTTVGYFKFASIIAPYSYTNPSIIFECVHENQTNAYKNPCVFGIGCLGINESDFKIRTTLINGFDRILDYIYASIKKTPTNATVDLYWKQQYAYDSITVRPIMRYSRDNVKTSNWTFIENMSNPISELPSDCVNKKFTETDLYVDMMNFLVLNTPSGSTNTEIITAGALNSWNTVVHTTGNETIAGNKTFSNNITVNNNIPSVDLKTTKASISSPASTNSDIILNFIDSSNQKPFTILNSIETGGNVRTYLRNRCRNENDTANVESTVTIVSNKNGSTYATAPHTPLNANGNEIATAGWVNARRDGGYTREISRDMDLGNLNEMELNADGWEDEDFLNKSICLMQSIPVSNNSACTTVFQPYTKSEILSGGTKFLGNGVEMYTRTYQGIKLIGFRVTEYPAPGNMTTITRMKVR